jgi:hypothetical protein
LKKGLFEPASTWGAPSLIYLSILEEILFKAKQTVMDQATALLQDSFTDAVKG